jgi:hypothetical protein
MKYEDQVKKSVQYRAEASDCLRERYCTDVKAGLDSAIPPLVAATDEKGRPELS